MNNRFFIAQNGQDQDNKSGILNGHRDEPLTIEGVDQAQMVADKLQNSGIVFDKIFSSPFVRAFRTAEIISQALGGPLPVSDDRLKERRFGVMTGQAESMIMQMCAPDVLQTDHFIYFLNPESGETFPELLNRAKDILDVLEEKYDDQTILLVTHAELGKMLYAAYYNIPWDKALAAFDFKNTEVLFLSKDSPVEESHLFTIA